MDIQKVYCNTYRDVPSLLPYPGEGERQASLLSDACRGKDYWIRQSLEPVEPKKGQPSVFGQNMIKNRANA